MIPIGGGTEMRVSSFALAAALSISSPTVAQTPSIAAPPSETVKMDLAVTDAMRSVLADKLDEGHIAMLAALGHQQAVAATCAGFVIEPGAFSSEFDLIYDDQKGEPRTLNASERRDIERQATLALGMAFGAQIAISANDHPAFCEAAVTERSSGKVKHLVWAK